MSIRPTNEPKIYRCCFTYLGISVALLFEVLLSDHEIYKNNLYDISVKYDLSSLFIKSVNQ